MNRIQIALFDKSPVIKKMLSHCLQYFSADVYAFMTLQDFVQELQKQQIPAENFSAIFVDWEIKQEGQALGNLLSQQFPAVPLVLLYHTNLSSVVSRLPQGHFPNRVKKPINPQEVREMFLKLVPQAKESPIQSFLQFPKTEQEKPEQGPLKPSGENSLQPPYAPVKKSLYEDIKEKTHTSITGIKNVLTKTTENSKNILDTLVKKKDMTKTPPEQDPGPKTLIQKGQPLPEKPQPDYPPLNSSLKEESISSQPTPQAPSPPASSSPAVSSQLASPSVSSSQVSGLQQAPSTQTQGPTKSLSPALKKPSEVLETAELTQQSKPAIDKENLSLNEDTKNDLAPMAIKSSMDTKSHPFNNEEQWLAFFEKYKDSLAFQQILEQVLKKELAHIVQQILKGADVPHLLKEPLKNFKEGQQFKFMVEKQIASYVQSELPLVVRSVLEEEIKKIMG